MAIIEWVGILLNGFKAVINNGGNISREFNIARRCRQGDPIASLLFIIAIEILCLKLRNEKGIEGFKIANFRALLSLYADNCTIFLAYKESDLRKSIEILNLFYRVSGLEIHLGKTQCVRIGNNPERIPIICEDLGITWAQDFKLLGVHFNATTLNYNNNFDIKMAEIVKETRNWKHRFLTPIK